MAQKIQTLFIDDIDGGEADGTVRFGLDGTEYEIDLSKNHSEALRTALASYIEHSRKVGGAARRVTRGSRRTAAAVDNTAVRAWAKEQGIDIKERGRIPGDIVERYRTSTGA